MEEINENSEINENNENNITRHAVGMRFNKAGRVYYFDPSGIELEMGDAVVVDTASGLEMGEVVIVDSAELTEKVSMPLKPVIRKVTAKDLERMEGLKQQEKDAMAECERLVEKMKLPMKLISAQYNIDGKRLTIVFGAEGRVDFRELVRDLSRSLKVRIEMRQVGSRDEAKLLGGYGRCGRQLCCASFLSELNPVSIKMAKEQGLPLSPMKISGLCGRLLCCLGYEYEQYRSMREKMPRVGKQISTPMGEGIVRSTNPVSETVTVELESGARTEITLEELNGKKEDRAKDKEETKPEDKKKDKPMGRDSDQGRKRGSQKRRGVKRQSG
ncbi:stage 0 sporulation family protein [Chloroflexota bacterium]